MSFDQSKYVSSICSIINDINNNVLDEFGSFLSTKIDLDTETIEEYIIEFKELLEKSKYLNNAKLKKTAIKGKGKDTGVKKQKKGNPSIYNLFIRFKISSADKQVGAEKGTYMNIASDLWKNSEEGKFYKKRATELKNENKELDNQEIFDIIKDEWNKENGIVEDDPIDSKPSSSKTDNEEEEEEEVKPKTKKTASKTKK